MCLATQLVFSTVAMAILFYQGSRGKIKIDAILTIVNYCDTMNSSHLSNTVAYRCALGVHEDLQINSLLKMKKMVEDMRFCDDMLKKTKKPFQKGILISIQSTMSLFKELKK